MLKLIEQDKEDGLVDASREEVIMENGEETVSRSPMYSKHQPFSPCTLRGFAAAADAVEESRATSDLQSPQKTKMTSRERSPTMNVDDLQVAVLKYANPAQQLAATGKAE